MKNSLIQEAAKLHYIENIMGEPLDEKVPIDCFIKGAEFIQSENSNKFNVVLKSIEHIQKAMLDMKLHNEWLEIVNALRLTAGMKLIFLKKNCNNNK